MLRRREAPSRTYDALMVASPSRHGEGAAPRGREIAGRHTMITGLGYAGFGSDKLEDWRQFGTGLLGFQAIERRNSLLAFRMDDRKQRVVIDRGLGDGARFFGWEVVDAAALDAL